MHYYSTRRSQSGFTLIEMLITVAIGLLMVGMGIAGYLGFNDKQRTLSAAREIETIFQTGATRAQAGDLGGCDQLAGYRLSFVTTADPVTADLSSVCSDGTTNSVRSYELPEGIEVSFAPSISYMQFPVLQGGVVFNPSAATVDITLTNSALSSSYVFSLSQGGDINEGAWE